MPVVSVTSTGNGQLVVTPHGIVQPNTVITVQASPYEGETLENIHFIEDINGSYQEFFPTLFSENLWKFRLENYDTVITARFSEDHPTPPEPPDPPTPTPDISNILPILFKNSNWWRY